MGNPAAVSAELSELEKSRPPLVERANFTPPVEVA